MVCCVGVGGYLLLCMLREAVDPDARRGDRLAEAQLDARPADVLAVHSADRLHHARYRRVLTERIAGPATAAFLDVDFDDAPEMFELFPQLLLRHVFF